MELPKNEVFSRLIKPEGEKLWKEETVQKLVDQINCIEKLLYDVSLLSKTFSGEYGKLISELIYNYKIK